jgi:steroid delta-isomerase-like uncharacterized protein
MFRSLLICAFIALMAMPTAIATEADNVAKVKALFAAFNAKNIDALVQLYAPDAAYVSPDVPPGTKGHAAIRSVYSGLFRDVPDVTDTVTRIVAQGDTVAVEFVARGTAPAQPNQPPRKFAVPIASFITFDKQGKIIRDAAYFDR